MSRPLNEYCRYCHKKIANPQPRSEVCKRERCQNRRNNEKARANRERKRQIEAVNVAKK